MSNQAVMFNQGQACTAGSRTYVQEDIYDKFVSKAVEIAQSLQIGDPFDMSTQHGAQVSPAQLVPQLFAACPVSLTFMTDLPV